MARPIMPVGTHGAISHVEGPEGIWIARTRYRDLDGKTRQVERWGTSRGQATRRLKADLAERLAPSHGEIKPSTTVAALVESWLDDVEAEGRLRPQTLRAYRTHVRPALDRMGSLRLHECTPAALSVRLRDLEKRSATAVARARTVLTQAFQMAVEMGAIAHNPVLSVRPPRIPPPRPKALTPSDVRLLRKLVREHRMLLDDDGHRAPGPQPTSDLADFVDLLLATGMRPAELLAAEWQNITQSAEATTVEVTGTLVEYKGKGGLHKQAIPKTDSSRRVLTLPATGARIIDRRYFESKSEKLFATKNSTWISPANMRRSMRAAIEDSAVSWVTPRAIRRTVATSVQRHTMSLEATRAQLGHSSGSAVTERHYIVKDQRAPDLSEALEAFFES